MKIVLSAFGNRETPLGIFDEDAYGGLWRYSHNTGCLERIEVVPVRELEVITNTKEPNARQKLDDLIAYYYHRKTCQQ